MRWLLFLFPPLIFLLVAMFPTAVGAQAPTPGLPLPQTPSSNPFPHPDPDCGNCFLICTAGTPTPTRTPSPTPTPAFVSPTPTPTPTPSPTPTPLPSQLSAVGDWSTAREGTNSVLVMMNSISCGSSESNRSGRCQLQNEVLSDAFISVTTTSNWGTFGSVTFVGFQTATYSLTYNLRSYCGSRGCGSAMFDIRYCGDILAWPWDGSSWCMPVIFGDSVGGSGVVSGTYSFSVRERGLYRVYIRAVGGGWGDPDRGSAEGWVAFFSDSFPPPPPPTPTPTLTPACRWFWDLSVPEGRQRPHCEFSSSRCLYSSCSGFGDADFEYSCPPGLFIPGRADFSLVVSSTSPFTVSFAYAPEAGYPPGLAITSSIRGPIAPPPAILMDSSSSDYSLSGRLGNLGSMYVAIDCGAARPVPTPTPTPAPIDRCRPSAPPGCYWNCYHPIPRPGPGTCFSWDIPPSWAESVLGPCRTYRICLYDFIPQISAALWPLTYFVSRLFVAGLLLFYGLVLVIRYFSQK